MNITRHAYRRAKERLKIPKRSVRRMARIAWAEGLTYDDTRGSFRRYVDGLRWRYGTDPDIRIYGEFIYVFNNHHLLTLYRIPNKYRHAVRKIRRR